MKAYVYEYSALVALPSGVLDTFPVHLDTSGNLTLADLAEAIVHAQSEDDCKGALLGFQVQGLAFDGTTHVGAPRVERTPEWRGWRQKAREAMADLCSAGPYRDETVSGFTEMMFRAGFAMGKTAESVGARIAEYLVQKRGVALPTAKAYEQGWT